MKYLIIEESIHEYSSLFGIVSDLNEVILGMFEDELNGGEFDFDDAKKAFFNRFTVLEVNGDIKELKLVD